MKNTISLKLPAHLHQWVEAQTTVSGFAEPSEFIQHLLMERRLLNAKEHIEKRLLKAIETDGFVDFEPSFFKELDLKLEKLAQTKHKKRHAVKS